MRVYLVRHGEAVMGHDNPERPLTERGRNETKKVSEFMGRTNVNVRIIEHSGKLRAQQTAEILDTAVQSDEGVAQVEGLLPNDEVGPWARDLGTGSEDVVLVGHLPFMSKLASKLLSGSDAIEIFEFRPSAVLCLERTSERGWRTLCFITPDHL